MMRGLKLVLLGAVLAYVAPVAAQSVPGDDCRLCRAVGAGEESVIPTDTTQDRRVAYLRNLGEISNCLDRTLLGPDRRFTPRDRWQEDIMTKVSAGLWVDTLENGGLPENCDDCLDSAAKISALYIITFGQAGFDTAAMRDDAKAQLICKAVFVDLEGASETVSEAAGTGQ